MTKYIDYSVYSVTSAVDGAPCAYTIRTDEGVGLSA